MQNISSATLRTILWATLFLFFTGVSAQAATLIVTKTDDTNDGICDSDCSLREAIAAAPLGSDIEFASPLFDSPQVITLSDAAGFQELKITKNLIIAGRGADLLTIRRDPASPVNFRIFDVLDPNGIPHVMHVVLSGMTITGGQIINPEGGGGILNNFSDLNVIGCNVTGNLTSLLGGGIHNTGGGGLIVNASTISNNQALAGSNGGAGIQVSSGRLSLVASTVSGNVRGSSGGGINNAGGIYVVGDTFSITSCTITDNQVLNATTGNAGGLVAEKTTTVRNTIIAGNRSNATVPDVEGFIVSQGYNFVGNRGAVTAFNQDSDQTGTAAAVKNPQLGALALNGGPTPTAAVLPGSPALDKGNSFGLAVDQRSFPRPIDNPGAPPAPGGDNTDIGAYEAQTFNTYVVTKTDDTNDGVCDADCSLREAIATAPAGSEIDFASPLFDSPQVITLSPAAGFQELAISKNLLLTGKGANVLTIRRDPAASANFRIFDLFDPNGIPGATTIGLTGMTITGGSNTTVFGGGGIVNNLNVLNLTDCTVTGNSTIAAGGGINSTGGTLNIVNSSIVNNQGLAGSNGAAGIQLNSTGMVMVNSTVSGNVRGSVSGGTSNAGGIYASGPGISLTSCTITDNEVDNPGTGSAGGVLGSSQVTVRNTIIAGNRNNATTPDVANGFVSQGYNLIGNRGAVAAFNQTGDQSGTGAAVLDPQLDPLALYAGASYAATTPTHRLKSTSPALDKGNSFGLTTDQRGRIRPLDINGASNTADGSDIGAFELQFISQHVPLAIPDFYTVNEDTLLSVNAPGILANDTDDNDDPLTAILVTATIHGQVTLNANGSFTYLPNANFNGQDSFTYKANDGQNNSAIESVGITITPVNDPPVVANDAYLTSMNQTLTVNAPGILANDHDPEGGTLTATPAQDPAHGTLTLNANGSFIYTPAMNYVGPDDFLYAAEDPLGAVSVAEVDITVNSPHQLTVTKTDDTNDGVCDADCSLREAIAAAGPGDEVIFASPLFDSAQTITLSDAAGFGPLVVSKSLSIIGRGANLLTVQRLITSAPFRIFNLGANGTVISLSGLTITGGRDSGGGGGILNSGADMLFLSGCHITANLAAVSGGGLRNLAGAVTLAGSTVSDNLTLSGTGLGNGIHSSGGTLSITNSTISGNFRAGTSDNYGGGGIWLSAGTATISSTTITDNGAGGPISASGVLISGGATMTVANSIIAGNRSNVSKPDVAVDTGTFLSQGYNLIGNTGTVTSFNQTGDQAGTPAAVIDPRLGALADNGGPTPTHALMADSPALDQGRSAGSTTDQRGSPRPINFASVNPAPGGDDADIGAYELQSGPVAPIAHDDIYSTMEDNSLTVAAPGVLANDFDVNGNSLTASVVTNPVHGMLTLNPDGGFVYLPNANYNGTDSFTYQVTSGGPASNIATVHLTVTPVNDPPVARDDSYQTSSNVQLTVAVPGVLANDSDLEGSPITALPVSGPSNGMLTLNANGSFAYLPGPDFTGTDSFTYAANDGAANSKPATVSITVNPGNHLPVAHDDLYHTKANQQLTVAAPGVLANDTDPDGDPLTALLVGQAAHGALTFQTNGSFTYLPNTDFVGTDSFTYRAHDAALNSNLATVTITVNPPNQAPVATEDTYFVQVNTTLTVAAPGVLANDSDPDGDPLTAVLVTQPTHGGVTFAADGSFTFVPELNYVGADAFTYRATDGLLTSAVTTVNIAQNNNTLTVTKIEDTNDGVCDDDCSLREAIAAAAPGDEIVFASPLFDTARTINLTDAPGFQSLLVNKTLTITGPGANLLTVGNLLTPGNFRIFAIGGAPNLTVTLTGMTITGGGDGSSGGGVLNDGDSTLFLTACHVTGNITGDSGGGIRNVAGTLTITDSTISNNQTESNTGQGNGISSTGGTLTLINSTVSGNYRLGGSGNFGGGGIWVSGGTGTITGSTITDNGAEVAISAGGVLVSNGADITVSSSIIAGNRNNATTPDISADGRLLSHGYNLIGNVGSVTTFNQPGDQTGNTTSVLDPRLAPLGAYGGPTPTHALFFNSTAVNQADPDLPLAVDQRGVARTIGQRADIGSYELDYRFFADHEGPGGLGTLASAFTGLPYSDRISVSRANSLLGRPAHGSATATRRTGSRTDGVITYVYAVIAGTLPPGLTLDPNTGNISGTPTQIGTYTFTVMVTNTGDGLGGAQDYRMDVFGPTEAAVAVGGRVTTADGQGIANAQVSLTEQSGAMHTVSTNGFGYYQLSGVEGGQTVVVTVSAKRHRFTAQVISLTGSFNQLDFVGQ